MFGALQRKVWMLVIFWLVPRVGLGQPSISGNLSGNLGPGTFIVIGDCMVPEGQSLVIAPGTTLLFAGHFFFFVNGRLTAEGAEADSIQFRPFAPLPLYRWGGLRFQNGAASSSLSYCGIDHALNLFVPAAYGGAVFVQNTTLNLSHSRMTSSHAAMGGGLYGENATLTITNCVFAADSSDDDGAGLCAINCSITITGSAFYNNKCIGQTANGGGILLDHCNQALISACIFTGNHSAGT